jgi:hypothetical protein
VKVEALTGGLHHDQAALVAKSAAPAFIAEETKEP